MSSSKKKVIVTGSLVAVALLGWKMKSQERAPHEISLLQEEAVVADESRKPASVKAALPTADRTPAEALGEKEMLVKSLHTMKACYASESCDFPHTDPKSYDIAVGQRIKDLLLEYRDKYGKDASNRTEAESLSREFVASDDGYVQEASLDLLADLPPSAENLKALTEALDGTSDVNLVEQAMKEFERYMGTPDEPMVHQYLEGLIANGGVFASEQAAKSIFHFINPRSYAGYSRVAAGMPANSTAGKDLRTLLEEYSRLQTGG
jgi:hypothetical protein